LRGQRLFVACAGDVDRTFRSAARRQEAPDGAEFLRGNAIPEGARLGSSAHDGQGQASAKAAPKNRQAAISAARKAAFGILLAVERGHAHSDDLLRGKAVNALSAPDRHLATALVLGVLRWQIQLDHQVQSLLTRPNARLDAELRIALRLGAFQILHMDRIPARAAIDESVELAKQAGHRFASSMVNAVLRKLAGAIMRLKPNSQMPESSLRPASCSLRHARSPPET
jgi:transcription termination factor NusB